MGPEKQAVKYYLLGEAADVAALFLTREKELWDPRLTEPQDRLPSGPCTALLGSHGNLEHYRDFAISLLCTGVKYLAQVALGIHSTLPAAALYLSCWISWSWLDLVKYKQKYSQFLQIFLLYSKPQTRFIVGFW